MTYTIPSYTVRPGSVYQPNPISAGDFPVDFLASNVVGCWSTRRLLSTGSGNIIRGRDATTNEEDFTGSGYPAGVVTLASGGDAFVPQLYDQSGNTNHATQTVAASQPKLVDTGSLIVDASGRPVMEFDGVGGGIKASNVLTSGKSALSVALRCEFSSSIFVKRLFSLGVNVTERLESYSSAGKITFKAVASSALVADISSNNSLNDSLPHFCVMTAEENSFKLYIDGVLQSDIDLSGSFTIPSGASFFLGSYFNFNNNRFEGLLNDFVLFNKALNQSEVTQLHNALA